MIHIRFESKTSAISNYLVLRKSFSMKLTCNICTQSTFFEAIVCEASYIYQRIVKYPSHRLFLIGQFLERHNKSIELIQFPAKAVKCLIFVVILTGFESILTHVLASLHASSVICDFGFP